MILAYRLLGNDNNSYMLGDGSEVERCQTCGFAIDARYVNPAFVLRNKQADVSYTYDGRCIASLKVKELCIRHRYHGVEFLNLPSEPNFFLFLVHNVIKF